MQITLIALVQVAVIAVLAWSIYRTRDNAAKLKELKSKAWEEFKRSRLEAPDAEYSFDGGSARVVKVEETGGLLNVLTGRIDNYTLAVFAENAAGKLFHFRFSDARVILKPVDPGVLKLLQSTHS